MAVFTDHAEQRMYPSNFLCGNIARIPDQARNPRGFATKFYTADGNYDLVGLNWPVFFVRDPMMGPDNSELPHSFATPRFEPDL